MAATGGPDGMSRSFRTRRCLLNRLWTLLWTLWTPIGLLAIASAWMALEHYRHRPLAIASPQILEIRPGDGFSAITRTLQEQAILDWRWPFTALAVFEGRTGRIRAGEYRLAPGTTPQGLLDQLVKGEILLHRVTLVEGWSAAQARATLSQHPAIRATPDLDMPGLMAALGAPDLSPEGQFFPDTYFFPRGTTDLTLLRQAHERMRQELASAWSDRAPDLPLRTPEELLILASLVEKETAIADERAQIAGVFVRRLQLAMPLQTDPTVIFALGADYSGNLTREHLLRNHPYNTYRNAGLPPGPIALVGRAALVAAAHPAPGRALYFVSRGDGTHVFSDTLEAHNRAVACHQRNICQGSPP